MYILHSKQRGFEQCKPWIRLFQLIRIHYDIMTLCSKNALTVMRRNNCLNLTLKTRPKVAETRAVAYAPEKVLWPLITKTNSIISSIELHVIVLYVAMLYSFSTI